jgi:hypothetical protein
MVRTDLSSNRPRWPEIGRKRRSGDAAVSVMKATDFWDRHDASGRRCLGFAPIGAVVAKALVRTRIVVVREVSAKQASEVTLIEDDHVGGCQ